MHVSQDSAYEKARYVQERAHIFWMRAIGLEAKTPEKAKVKKKKASPRKRPRQPVYYDAKWSRCADAELTAEQIGRLPKAMETHLPDAEYFDEAYPTGKYYCFAERVVRAYVFLWGKSKSDPQHYNRENVARLAVQRVYAQIRPWSDKPHHGNAHKGMRTMLPVIEHVLELPCCQHTTGSDEWIAQIITGKR